MTETVRDVVVRKSVSVRRPREAAFELFTRGIAVWWPTDTHALAAGRVADVVLEERVGGELYEVSEAGERAHWATVVEWDAPRRLVLAWKVNPLAAAPTEIEVTFSREGDGTRIDLEHRGWERLGDGANDEFGDYETGWDLVLGRYRAVADA